MRMRATKTRKSPTRPERATTEPIVDADAELVERLRQRDGVAYFQLHAQYRDRVYGLSLKLLGDPHMAEDVMQEVFLQVFRKLHLFRGDAKLSTWIFRITVNACRSRQRSLERERRLDPREVHARNMSRGIIDPEHEMTRGEMRADIERALAELTPEQREILLLKSVDELSYDEIGAATRLSRPRVRGKLYRARKAFREAYERGGTPPAQQPVEQKKKARRARSEGRRRARGLVPGERARPVAPPILALMAEAG